jgi:hypothetical protein
VLIVQINFLGQSHMQSYFCQFVIPWYTCAQNMDIVLNWKKKSIMKKIKNKIKLHDIIQQKLKLWLHFVLHIFYVNYARLS